MKSTNYFLAGCLMLALISGGLAGCAGGNRGGSERNDQRADDDERITSSVQAQLNQDPVFRFDEVRVNTFNGVVQLSGFVSTEEQKQHAAEAARKVSGIARVINNLSLRPEEITPSGQPNESPADAGQRPSQTQDNNSNINQPGAKSADL